MPIVQWRATCTRGALAGNCVQKAAVAPNQKTKWQQAAHRLKGSAANLGAFALADLCERAERNPGTPPEEKKELWENIHAELAAVRSFLSDITA